MPTEGSPLAPRPRVPVIAVDLQAPFACSLVFPGHDPERAAAAEAR